jgi:prolyl oligopeptidase
VNHGAWRATLVALAFAIGLPCAGALDLTPPETLVDLTSESYFGRTIPDPYRWLESTEAPHVIAWFRAQNDYKRSVLDALPGRAALHRRLVELNGADTHVRDVQLAGDALAYMRRGPDDATFKLYGRDNVNAAER